MGTDRAADRGRREAGPRAGGTGSLAGQSRAQGGLDASTRKENPLDTRGQCSRKDECEAVPELAAACSSETGREQALGSHR